MEAGLTIIAILAILAQFIKYFEAKKADRSHHRKSFF
jgi:hypothetical protein